VFASGMVLLNQIPRPPQSCIPRHRAPATAMNEVLFYRTGIAVALVFSVLFFEVCFIPALSLLSKIGNKR
jgi:hypothetical protein